MYTNTKKRSGVGGFTFVEVMVVVAIIGLLSAVVYASSFQARANARDKERKLDLKNIQLALELYKEAHGQYPAPCDAATSHPSFAPGFKAGPGSFSAGTGAQCDDDWIYGSASAPFVPNFIPELPQDPSGNDDSDFNDGYSYYSDGNEYKVFIVDTVETTFANSDTDEFRYVPIACGSPPEIQNSYAIYTQGLRCTR